MTAIQAFWSFLYALQHATSQAEDVAGGLNNAHSTVVYGGNALQAFLNALHSGGSLIMVWIDNAS